MLNGFSFRYSFTKHRSYFYQLVLLLGFKPHNIDLYKLAFCHSSLSLTDKNGNPLNNERLEFIGDAILDAVIADLLYIQFPNENEGRLSLMRSNLVNRKNLDKLSQETGIADFIITKIDNNHNQHVAGNAFEALIGAIYYDRGFYKCKYFINKIIETYTKWDNIKMVEEDFKSLIFHYTQKLRWELVFETYEAIEANEKHYHFISEISVNNQFIAQGKAWSKKQAEQNAAQIAINILKKNRMIID
jgi:ribonuclease-3